MSELRQQLTLLSGIHSSDHDGAGLLAEILRPAPRKIRDGLAIRRPGGRAVSAGEAQRDALRVARGRRQSGGEDVYRAGPQAVIEIAAGRHAQGKNPAEISPQ